MPVVKLTQSKTTKKKQPTTNVIFAACLPRSQDTAKWNNEPSKKSAVGSRTPSHRPRSGFWTVHCSWSYNLYNCVSRLLVCPSSNKFITSKFVKCNFPMTRFVFFLCKGWKRTFNGFLRPNIFFFWRSVMCVLEWIRRALVPNRLARVLSAPKTITINTIVSGRALWWLTQLRIDLEPEKSNRGWNKARRIHATWAQSLALSTRRPNPFCVSHARPVIRDAGLRKNAPLPQPFTRTTLSSDEFPMVLALFFLNLETNEKKHIRQKTWFHDTLKNMSLFSKALF